MRETGADPSTETHPPICAICTALSPLGVDSRVSTTRGARKVVQTVVKRATAKVDPEGVLNVAPRTRPMSTERGRAHSPLPL
jgi:hypothetical protein